MLRIGYIVGSLSSASINRQVAQGLTTIAPEGVELVELDYSALPQYSADYDADYPQEGKDWKQAIEDVDGVIILTPEYLRSIPGSLKNALDWASRPWGTNSFNLKPVAIAGASIGAIGTAAAQQHLRSVLAHLNAPTLGQPEVFLTFSPEDFGSDGEIVNDATRGILGAFLESASAHVEKNRQLVSAAV
jgi:chromate reductase